MFRPSDLHGLTHNYSLHLIFEPIRGLMMTPSVEKPENYTAKGNKKRQKAGKENRVWQASIKGLPRGTESAIPPTHTHTPIRPTDTDSGSLGSPQGADKNPPWHTHGLNMGFEAEPCSLHAHLEARWQSWLLLFCCHKFIPTQTSWAGKDCDSGVLKEKTERTAEIKSKTHWTTESITFPQMWWIGPFLRAVKQ